MKPTEVEATSGAVETAVKKKSPGLGKVFSLVAILTFLSKFVGLLRDIFVLGAYGASAITDAYNYAYLFTGNVLILFGGVGGPFHQSTVAVLTPRKESPDAGKLIFQIVAITALILTAVTFAIWFAEPNLVSLVQNFSELGKNAAEFVRPYLPGSVMSHIDASLSSSATSSPELIGRVGEQLRIMLPLILIAGVIGILYGVSNVYGEFTWPSLSPAIASIAMIVAIKCFKDDAGLCLAWGTTIGGVLQLMAQLPATLPHMKFKLGLKPEPGAGEYTRMLWPAAISTSIGQITVYIDAMFAWMIERPGAWTAVTNSNRLVQLPLGILLTAMLVPILPRFTEQVGENKIDDLKAEFRKGLRILWFLSFPAAALMLALPQPMIALLFQRGQFKASDTEMFTVALVWLVPSIIFYVGRDLITRVFYAYKDSKTPYKVAMVAIVVKAFLDWLFVVPLQLGVAGLSLATTLLTVFNLSFLAILLRRKIGNLGLTLLLKPLFIMLFGSAVCSLCAFGSYYGIAHLAPEASYLSQEHTVLMTVFDKKLELGFFLKTLNIGVSCAIAFAIYVLICIAFKLDEPHAVMTRLKRKSIAKPATTDIGE